MRPPSSRPEAASSFIVRGAQWRDPRISSPPTPHPLPVFIRQIHRRTQEVHTLTVKWDVTFTINVSYHPSMSHRATYRLFGKDVDSDEIIPVEAESATADSSDEDEES